MTSSDFHAATLALVKNYWRVKAASALASSSPLVSSDALEYANVPAVGITAQNFGRETVAEAMLALRNYVAQRLPRDLFLALIAEFESRMVVKLRALGESEVGTMGDLQSRIQARVSLPQAIIEDLNEIRERRNAMIHHGDIATTKYVAASSKVLPRAAYFVSAVVAGDNVGLTETYLAYAADVLVRYSNCLG